MFSHILWSHTSRCLVLALLINFHIYTWELLCRKQCSTNVDLKKTNQFDWKVTQTAVFLCCVKFSYEFLKPFHFLKKPRQSVPAAYLLYNCSRPPSISWGGSWSQDVVFVYLTKLCHIRYIFTFRLQTELLLFNPADLSHKLFGTCACMHSSANTFSRLFIF